MKKKKKKKTKKKLGETDLPEDDAEGPDVGGGAEVAAARQRLDGHPLDGPVLVVAQTVVVGREEVARQRRVRHLDVEVLVDPVRREKPHRSRPLPTIPRSTESAAGGGGGGGGKLYTQLRVAKSLWTTLCWCRYSRPCSTCRAIVTRSCVHSGCGRLPSSEPRHCNSHFFKLPAKDDPTTSSNSAKNQVKPGKTR